MMVTDIIPKQVVIQFELTLSEVDDISLALSKCSVDADSSCKEAAQTLVKFAEMLNGLLERIENEQPVSGK